jgi:hypothetical protein
MFCKISTTAQIAALPAPYKITFKTHSLVRRLSNFWPEIRADIRPYDFSPMKTDPKM